jgi:hypothetical protein
MIVCDNTLQFSPYVKWSARHSLDIRQSGIYLLALLKDSPDNQPANVLAPEGIYFGIPEKPNRTVKDRLDAFHKSAILGKFGHSAGATYRQLFGPSHEHLYVAVCPIKIEDPIRRCAFIMYADLFSTT